MSSCGPAYRYDRHARLSEDSGGRAPQQHSAPGCETSFAHGNQIDAAALSSVDDLLRWHTSRDPRLYLDSFFLQCFAADDNVPASIG